MRKTDTTMLWHGIQLANNIILLFLINVIHLNDEDIAISYGFIITRLCSW